MIFLNLIINNVLKQYIVPNTKSSVISAADETARPMGEYREVGGEEGISGSRLILSLPSRGTIEVTAW